MFSSRKAFYVFPKIIGQTIMHCFLMKIKFLKVKWLVMAFPSIDKLGPNFEGIKPFQFIIFSCLYHANLVSWSRLVTHIFEILIPQYLTSDL